MAQVTARIVVAQASNPAPGGYSYGGRDGLNLNALVTLTNQDNTSATSHVWEIFPAVGLEEADYTVSGKESATCTLTPPASTGYGDLAVRLTVRGDPLPGGKPNVATAEVLLGVRAPLSGYGAGLPIVHPHEGLLGGKVTLNTLRGAIGRLAEAVRAFKLAFVAGAPPSGAAGGDLSGTYPNPTVAKVRGIPLNVEVEDAAGSSGRILVSKTGGGMAPTDGQFYLTEAPTLTGQVLVWDHSGKVYVLQHVDAIVDTDRVLAALAAAAVDVSFGDQELVDVATPTSDGAAANKAFVEDYADTAAAQAASDVVAPWRAQGVAGSTSLDSTTWTTIGTLHIDPSTLPSPAGKVRVYTLHADLEVVEASAGTVQAQVRLLDASLTSLGSVTSTLSGATTFPEHKSATLTAGGSNGQVRPDATTYLVQLRRSGGSSGDLALCHNAYLEVIWEPS